MKFVRPVTVTDAVLTSSTVPETDYAAWNAPTNYAKGQRVTRIGVHRNFENLLPGVDAGLPEATPSRWLDVGATNRWKMFDQARGSATTATDEIVTVLTPGAIDSLSLLDVVADHATVVMMVGTTKVYDRTISTAIGGTSIDNWYSYFFEPIGTRAALIFDNIPPYSGGVITVTVSGVSLPSSGTGGTGGTGGVAVATFVTRNATTRATTFSFMRIGDTSGPKTQAWQIVPSSLSGRLPTSTADFGGTYPSGSVSWSAGETATKTVTVTPSSDASPE